MDTISLLYQFKAMRAFAVHRHGHPEISTFVTPQAALNMPNKDKAADIVETLVPVDRLVKSSYLPHTASYHTSDKLLALAEFVITMGESFLTDLL